MDQVLHKRVFSSAFTWIVQNKSLIRLIKISYVLSKSSTHVFSNQTENFTPSLPCPLNLRPSRYIIKGWRLKVPRLLGKGGGVSLQKYRYWSISFKLDQYSQIWNFFGIELIFLSLQILFLMNNFPHEHEQVQTVLIKRKSHFF